MAARAGRGEDSAQMSTPEVPAVCATTADVRSGTRKRRWRRCMVCV